MSNMNEHLKAYIDGELSGDLAREVEQALQRDASLRKEFDEMRRISSTLREAHVAAPAVGLDATLGALTKNAKPVRPRFMRMLPAFGVIATCAVALVMVGRFNGSTPMARYNDEFPMAAEKRPDLANQPRETMASSPPADMSLNDSETGGGIRLNEDVAPMSRGRAGGGESEEDQKRSLANLQHGADFDDGGLQVQTNIPAKSRQPVPSFPLSSVERKMEIQQQIIKTGDIGLEVTNAKDTVAKLTKLTKKLGGLVDTSNLTGDNKSGMTGNMVLRVPVAAFEAAMAEVQKMGKVTGISSSAQDVTSDIVGNDAKLKTMANQEVAYQKILSGAKRVNDVLSVKDRLDTVQQEIATLMASQKALKGQAAMSTITVSITQPAPKKVAAIGPVKDDWLNKSWTSAWLTLSAAGRKITEALIYLVVFCPVWIPIVVLANLFTRRLRQAT